jgi:hypothetical protein
MLSTALPPKFPIPWANAAGGGYIRAIPQGSQIGVQNGAASLNDGFPPNCFVPIAGGGSWPFGQDFNGILNQVTRWQQLQQAGAVTPYDATFQTAIGGYPKGALVWSGTNGTVYQSTAENNVTNPNTGGAGWSIYTLVDPGVGVGGAPGPSGLTISGSTANGAGLRLLGNGATTPSKWIRARNGVLEILNSAYSAVIASLTDSGSLVTASSIFATTGNITAQAGRLRASLGAFGSGDANAAAILSDFTFQSAGGGFWWRAPNGFIIQILGFSIFGTVINQPVLLPVTFPSSFIGVVASFGSSLALGANGAAPQATLGVTPNTTSQFLASNTGFNPGSAYGCTAIAVGT